MATAFSWCCLLQCCVLLHFITAINAARSLQATTEVWLTLGAPAEKEGVPTPLIVPAALPTPAGGGREVPLEAAPHSAPAAAEAGPQVPLNEPNGLPTRAAGGRQVPLITSEGNSTAAGSGPEVPLTASEATPSTNDSGLEAALTASEAVATTADSGVKAALPASEAVPTTADSGLQAALTAVEGVATTADSGVKAALPASEATPTPADSGLEAAVTALEGAPITTSTPQTSSPAASQEWACPPLTKELIDQWALDSFIVITVSDYLVYEHFGTNFIRNMQQLDITHVLYGAADQRTAAKVREQNMPCFAADPQLQEGQKPNTYTWGSEYWSRMTWLKVEMVQKVVELGFHVIHTDADAAWYRDPIPYFKQHMGVADMLVSSDGLQSQLPSGEDRPEPAQDPSTNFNTGVYMITNTEGGRALLKGWLGIRAVFKGNDQTGFYEFVRRGHNPNPKIRSQAFSVLDGAAWVAALPVQSFMHSYTLFLMQLDKAMGVQPYEVHMVWGHSNREGKMHRMREALVSFDDAHYYEDKRLLLVDLELPPVPENYTHWNDTEAMIEVHVRAVGDQLQQLASAFALAMVLNRTLILPKMLCFCYKNWFGLEKCRIPGDSYTVYPIVCPASQVMNVERLYKPIEAGPYHLRFREHSFLDNPRTPGWVKESQQWLIAGTPDCGFCGTEGKHHDGQPQLVVPELLDDKQLLSLVSGPTSSTVLLRVPNAPRLLRRFINPSDQEQFNQAMRELQVNWCCRMPEEMKRLNAKDGELLPLLPKGLQLSPNVT